MPLQKATEVNLNEEEQTGLEQLVRRHNVGQQMALRARIVLAAGQGQSNHAIAAKQKVSINNCTALEKSLGEGPDHFLR